MGSSTGLLAYARGALPLVVLGQEAGGKAGRMRPGWIGGILHTLGPMDPPEVGPRRSPGLSGPEVHGLVHPVIPRGRPCALFPARPGLRYRCSRLYTTTSWGGAGWLRHGVGSRGPSVLGWVPRPGGRVLGWVLTWGLSWDGYPDLGSRLPLGGGSRSRSRR